MSLWGAKNARPERGGSPFGPGEASDLVLPPSQDGLHVPGASRKSQGIRSFFEHLSSYSGLRILDLGMLSQGTVRYLGGLGHRINFVSLIHSFDAARARSLNADGGISADLASRIVRMELEFPPDSFDAVLAWDVLQHLDRSTMRSAIAQLSRIVRPNGVIFCLFHGDASKGPIPFFNCGIDSTSTISIREVGRRHASQEFSPRRLETLFPQFRAVHLYLKRDALLEVLVIC